MTIAEIIAALRCGNTVTAIDKQSDPKWFKTACKKAKVKNRVSIAEYVSYDSGGHWKLISADSVYELRLEDCAASLMRLGGYCELNIRKD